MVRAEDVTPWIRGEGRVARLLVSNSTMGVTAYSLGMNVTQPGRIGPEHVHEASSETMYVVQGKLLFVIGGEEYLCGPDTAVHVPAGVPHSFQNVGDAESKFVWVYAPPPPDHK